jgi:hypothetical protein
MSKSKHVAKTLKTILDHPIMEAILDRSSNIAPVIEEVTSWWRYDLFKRKPGIAYNSDTGIVTDLDLSCFLFELAERNAVINIPEYTSMRATKLKEGQGVISKDNRHGQVISLVANKKTFSFSLRIKDMNVVTTDQVGDFRNFSMTDLNGNWFEGWSDLQFIETAKENKFIFENKLNDGNQIHFENFVHPNRWSSLFGQYYFMTKALVERLSEESSFYFTEIKKMLDEGIKYPVAGAPVEWPATEKIAGKKIKVDSFEVEIDIPDNDSKFPVYEHNQDTLVELTRRRKLFTYTLTPKLNFAIRTVEFAYFKFGKDNIAPWIENAIWEKDYIQKGKRTKWDRLVLFQPGVGEVGVSIRKRVYETTQEVSESYYAARVENVKNEIAMILDESGSMGIIRDPIIDLFNQQVDAIKANTDGIESRVSLVTFSNRVKTPILWRKASDELNKIDYKSYQPAGMTALYDAIGLTAEKYQSEKLDENTNYLFVILTDGAENNSSKYRFPQQIGDLIEKLQNTGKWTFTYIGAGQDLKDIQQKLKINKGNITDFVATAAGVTKAAFTMTRGINSYYSATKGGSSNVSNFYDDKDKDKDPSKDATK